MEKDTFSDMKRPKEEDSEEWLGATAAQYRQPAAVGGVAGSAVVGRRLPKFSGATPLEPYLAQLRIAARYYGWGMVESAAQLALALEGMALQVLLDLAPADRRDLQALTLALERRFGQRRVVSHSRELLTSRRRREGERLGAYAADVLLYAQRGYPDFPAAAREELALQSFLRGLAPPRLGLHVRLAGPPNLDMALELAERAEGELSKLQPSGAPQPHVRQADYERDEDKDDEEECFQAWTSPQRPRQRPPQRPPPDDRRRSGAVSAAMSQAIWPVTALHRHHGLDHLVRRKTAAERPSEGTAAPDSCPSPRSVRSGWRPGPRQGPLPPLRDRRPTLHGPGGHWVDHLPGASGRFSGHHRRTLGGVDGDQRPPDDRYGTGDRSEGKEAAGRQGG